VALIRSPSQFATEPDRAAGISALPANGRMMCYHWTMKKRSSPNGKRSAASGIVLGRERFAKISAVEGIELTPAMKRRVAEFDRRGLSGEERRRSIIRLYRGR
jgi:hypothetical protein